MIDLLLNLIIVTIVTTMNLLPRHW